MFKEHLKFQAHWF